MVLYSEAKPKAEGHSKNLIMGFEGRRTLHRVGSTSDCQVIM